MRSPGAPLLVGVALAAACHRGPAPAAATPAAATPATTLNVEVRALDGRSPVEGAEVRLLYAGGAARSERVDASGRVSFGRVPAGAAELEVRRIGLLSVRRAIELKPGCRARATARLAAWQCDTGPGCVQPESQLEVAPCAPDV